MSVGAAGAYRRKTPVLHALAALCCCALLADRAAAADKKYGIDTGMKLYGNQGKEEDEPKVRLFAPAARCLSNVSAPVHVLLLLPSRSAPAPLPAHVLPPARSAPRPCPCPSRRCPPCSNVPVAQCRALSPHRLPQVREAALQIRCDVCATLVLRRRHAPRVAHKCRPYAAKSPEYSAA